MASDKKAPPVHKVRVGFVTAAIWKNGDGYHSVTISKAYKDGDTYKDTDFLSPGDLLNAAKSIERAEEWISQQ